MTTQATTPVPKTIPLMIGRYAILGRAAIGVSNTYRARDPKGGLVTVYLFPSDAAAKGRLLNQLAAAFETCSTIEHPNVLRLIDYGPEGSSGYLVTEWTEATTLARLIEFHGRLPEANVIRFAAQTGQALDHTRNGESALCRPGPASVLVRHDGLTKLIPFSLPDENANPLNEAAALLKPEFAASLAAGYAGVKQIPFSEAVSSLGKLIHEALTGTMWVPPEQPTPGSRRRRPPPRLVGLSERTERAIRRATDPNPAKRPPTCADFLKLLRGRPMAAGTPKPDARPATEADNRRSCVRYSLGVGSNCTINTSVFDDTVAVIDSQEVWPLVVQDVSATGIGILLARRCESGTELLVEVAAGMDRSVRSLPVRVVRVRKDNHGHWMHGCEFLTPLDEPDLLALLAQIGRNDLV